MVDTRPRTYAGVGSRRTPPDVLAVMSRLAWWLDKNGWHLNTGAAQGADSAFMQGARIDHETLFIPWEGFQSLRSGMVAVDPTPPSMLQDCMRIAARNHPAWRKCSAGARKLHARNARIVLGRDLRSPVRFVVCWTPEGQGGGGTGCTVRIAREAGVPVFDLATTEPRAVCLAAQHFTENPS